MTNTNEDLPAADASRGGPVERAPQDVAEEGNVVAFRPKPARHPDSHPPPPPTAA